MEHKIVRELNQRFRIYFPYEEILIYLQKSKLSDSPLPAFSELHLMPVDFHPNKISFRSCYAKEGFLPDKTTPLIEFKRKSPNVSYEKLEILYEKNLLAKYEWTEDFDPKKLSWASLLSMCNGLVKRSATENYVFLRFSVIDDETIELITVPVAGLVLLIVLVVPTTRDAVFTFPLTAANPSTELPCPTTSILSPVRLLLNPTIAKLLSL